MHVSCPFSHTLVRIHARICAILPAPRFFSLSLSLSLSRDVGMSLFSLCGARVFRRRTAPKKQNEKNMPILLLWLLPEKAIDTALLLEGHRHIRLCPYFL